MNKTLTRRNNCGHKTEPAILFTKRCIIYVFSFLQRITYCSLLRTCFRLFTQLSYPRLPFQLVEEARYGTKITAMETSLAQLSMLTNFHRECKRSIVIPPGDTLGYFRVGMCRRDPGTR